MLLAAVTAAVAGAQPAPAQAATATISGTVVANNGGDFTIEQPGAAAGRINKMIAYANRLAAKKYPYVYGGGHRRVQVPSTGTSGHKKGFDCSATVAAVLAASGLWPKSREVPGDVGVIDDLLRAKVVAKGAGTGPYSVDLFDRPDEDIQMNIDGDFFGTGYTAKGGPAWMGAEAASYPKYRVYHVRPSDLKNRSSYRHEVTFEYPDSAAGYTLQQEISVGEKVQVTYRQSHGALIAVSASNTGG